MRRSINLNPSKGNHSSWPTLTGGEVRGITDNAARRTSKFRSFFATPNGTFGKSKLLAGLLTHTLAISHGSMPEGWPTFRPAANFVAGATARVSDVPIM
jgi:hypothetical protein